MKKWGFFGVILFLFPFFVNANVFDKKISNPYSIATYTIKDLNTNVVYNPYNSNLNDGVMNTLYNYKTYSITADITFLSNSSDTDLDIGQGILLYNGDDVLNYWFVPICVNHYNFSVSISSGQCPACFYSQNNVSILFDSDNTCKFVNDDFVGPVQYLSDPGSGTRAWLLFHVKTYRVPNTFLTATANDRFTITNLDPNYPLVYRFLNGETNEAGLYDLDGVKEKSLRGNSREVATIQNNNVNSPYKCENSYNNLNVSQGNYFSNDILTMSTSTLSLIRNIDDKNLFDKDNIKIGYTWNNTIQNNRSVSFIEVQPNKTYTLSAQNWNNLFYDIVYLDHIGATTNLYESGWYDGNRYPINSFTTSSGTNIIAILFKYQYAGTDIMNLSMFDNSKIQFEFGNRSTSYVPYSIYGFNNDISNGNNSVFSFTESNLKEKGKIQMCIKYLDDWNNEFNISCKDLIVGTESSFLGMQTHMYYDGRIEPYNTCLYGFGFLCGQKYPQLVQFQLIDESNSYYFKKPLLYYYESNYNKFTGYTEYDTDETSLYKNLPLYVPPGGITCYDTSSGIMYDYMSKEIIYDSKDSNSLFDNRVYQDNELASIFGDYELPDNFGLSGLINIPTDFVNQVRSGVCTPINLSFNIKGNNVNAVTLPCGSSFWNRADIVSFKPFLSSFFTGLFVYKIIFGLYFFIRHNRDPIKITNSDGGEGMMYL